MATRVQVILDEQEREAFRRQAVREGMPLSAWLRAAARERLASQQAPRMASLAALRSFFAASDAAEEGREPDWEEQRALIGRSFRSAPAK